MAKQINHFSADEISAAEFKAKCLQLMDQVAHQRTELIITKRGKPIAKLVPYDTSVPSLFGCMADSIKITGDILAPLDEDWYAEQS